MELEVAMIYAEGLYQAAKENNVVDEVRDEITQIDIILKGEKEFGEILMNPALHRCDKKKIINKIFQGRVHDEVLNFMYVLIDKGRTYGFHNMVREYNSIVDSAGGVGNGVIYSAFPITDEQKKKFEREAGLLLRKKICLRNKVDSSLIGGVKLFVDGKVIDISMKSRLEEMSGKIKEY